MEIRRIEKKIDGHSVTVNSLPTSKAFLMKGKIIKLIAPVFGELFGSVDLKSIQQSGLDADISGDSLASALQNFADRLDEAQLWDIIKQLLTTAVVDNKCMEDEQIIDVVFSGNFAFLYKVIGACLEVNFKSFLELILSGLGTRQ